MLKVTAKLGENFTPLFIRIKEITAVKVKDNKTIIFLKNSGHIHNKWIIVKETPEELGHIWMNDLLDAGKEIGNSWAF